MVVSKIHTSHTSFILTNMPIVHVLPQYSIGAAAGLWDSLLQGALGMIHWCHWQSPPHPWPATPSRVGAACSMGEEVISDRYKSVGYSYLPHQALQPFSAQLTTVPDPEFAYREGQCLCYHVKFLGLCYHVKFPHSSLTWPKIYDRNTTSELDLSILLGSKACILNRSIR